MGGDDKEVPDAVGQEQGTEVFLGLLLSQGAGVYSPWEQPQCLDPEG